MIRTRRRNPRERGDFEQHQGTSGLGSIIPNRKIIRARCSAMFFFTICLLTIVIIMNCFTIKSQSLNGSLYAILDARLKKAMAVGGKYARH
jgi:hypothetical protein